MALDLDVYVQGKNLLYEGLLVPLILFWKTCSTPLPEFHVSLLPKTLQESKLPFGGLLQDSISGLQRVYPSESKLAYLRTHLFFCFYFQDLRRVILNHYRSNPSRFLWLCYIFEKSSPNWLLISLVHPLEWFPNN